MFMTPSQGKFWLDGNTTFFIYQSIEIGIDGGNLREKNSLLPSWITREAFRLYERCGCSVCKTNPSQVAVWVSVTLHEIGQSFGGDCFYSELYSQVICYLGHGYIGTNSPAYLESGLGAIKQQHLLNQLTSTWKMISKRFMRRLLLEWDMSSSKMLANFVAVGSNIPWLGYNFGCIQGEGMFTVKSDCWVYISMEGMWRSRRSCSWIGSEPKVWGREVGTGPSTAGGRGAQTLVKAAEGEVEKCVKWASRRQWKKSQ